MCMMASHGERLLCMNCLEVVNGNLINGDQAALGRKGRGKQPSARARWESSPGKPAWPNSVISQDTGERATAT